MVDLGIFLQYLDPTLVYFNGNNFCYKYEPCLINITVLNFQVPMAPYSGVLSLQFFNVASLLYTSMQVYLRHSFIKRNITSF